MFGALLLSQEMACWVQKAGVVMVLHHWKRPSGCSPAVPSGTRCRVCSHSVTRATKGEELRGHPSQPPLAAGGRTKAREELALS